MLGFVAFVPWLRVLEGAPSARSALAAALAMSVAFALGVFWWFGVAIAGYAGAPAWTGLAALLLLAPALQPQLFVFAWVRHVAGPRGGLRRAFAAAFAYVAAEHALPKLFGDTLAHGLLPSPWLRQAGDLAGASGLTLVLLLANEASLAALRRGARAGPGLAARVRAAAAPASAVAALAAALAGYGAWRLAVLAADGPPPVLLRAALVQADLSNYAQMRRDLGSYGAVRRILDAHFALTESALAAGPLDAVLWPETVYPTTFGTPRTPDGAALDAEIAGFADRLGVSLVFGAFDARDGAEYNAAFFLAPGAPRAVYRKAAPFPLTERVPDWLDRPALRRRLTWLGTWRAGDGPRVVPFALPDGRVLRAAPLICYDAVEPRFAREAAAAGAELLVTLSNDSWFTRGSGPRLHLAVSAFRSLETRLPQLRVTNTGISAWIDARGTIHAQLGVHESGVLRVALPAGPGGITPAMRWADRLPWLAAAATAAILAHGAARRRRA